MTSQNAALHAVCRGVAHYDAAMALDAIAVTRSAFSIDDPWRIPSESNRISLSRATDGATPRLPTTVALYYDDECLTLVFCATDDHVVATYTSDDQPLYEEDVVEVFLSPEHPTRYFELEVNPLGAIFDASIVSEEGRRETMEVDLGWNAGALAAIRSAIEPDGTRTTDTVLRVPFAALGRGTPAAGETWRANLFRIDRHPTHGDEYTAWRPTLRNPPDFHVPASFGTLLF